MPYSRIDFCKTALSDRLNACGNECWRDSPPTKIRIRGYLYELGGVRSNWPEISARSVAIAPPKPADSDKIAVCPGTESGGFRPVVFTETIDCGMGRGLHLHRVDLSDRHAGRYRYSGEGLGSRVDPIKIVRGDDAD